MTRDRFSQSARQLISDPQPRMAALSLALGMIGDLSPFAETGAGTGYRAHRLRTRGSDILAFDQAPARQARLRTSLAKVRSTASLTRGFMCLSGDTPHGGHFVTLRPDRSDQDEKRSLTSIVPDGRLALDRITGNIGHDKPDSPPILRDKAKPITAIDSRRELRIMRQCPHPALSLRRRTCGTSVTRHNDIRSISGELINIALPANRIESWTRWVAIKIDPRKGNPNGPHPGHRCSRRWSGRPQG